MGKGAARPCKGTICFPSDWTRDRMRRMYPWQELRITTLQLQHHMWTVSLLMQDCLGQSHQVQQVAHSWVVQINLLLLDMAHEKPRTNFHGGTQTLVYRQTWGHPTSGMHGLVFFLYQVYTTLSGEVECEHTLLLPSNVCQVPPILALRGIPSMYSLWWILRWWGSGPKVIWSKCNCPTVKQKHSKRVSP